MSSEGIAWAFDAKPNTLQQKLILILLGDISGMDGCSSLNTPGRIADRAGMSVREVQATIAELETDGFLCRFLRDDDPRGRLFAKLNFQRRFSRVES